MVQGGVPLSMHPLGTLIEWVLSRMLQQLGDAQENYEKELLAVHGLTLDHFCPASLSPYCRSLVRGMFFVLGNESNLWLHFF
jgi:hypothetical protein